MYNNEEIVNDLAELFKVFGDGTRRSYQNSQDMPTIFPSTDIGKSVERNTTASWETTPRTLRRR